MTRKKTTASSDGGTPKKAKVVVEDEEEAGLEDEEEATVTLSVEKDALECDICCLPFQSEVFMASQITMHVYIQYILIGRLQHDALLHRITCFGLSLTIINYMTCHNNNQLHDNYII
jgi:hypothetical protein